jgi:hypothetical protein
MVRSLPVLLLTLSTLLAGAGCYGDISGPGGDDAPGGGGDDPDDPSDNPDDPIDPQDPDYATDHPRIYMPRNRDRLVASWQAGGPGVERFAYLVDAQLDGADLYDWHAWFTALAGQMTGEARYCDAAVAQADAFVASEEARIAGGSNPAVAFDSYLEVGARLGDVMLTYDWCFDATTNDQRQRWLAFAAATVWNVWNPDDAVWGGRSAPWSGWSIDNPSNNYYYSFLRATMLFGLAAHGEHPDAQGWLDFFRQQKIQGQLVPTFEAQLDGGGSREGTGYGVSMHRLWELYDLWHGSTGEDVARQTTHTRASMLYAMHAILPTRDRIAPIGDHARDSTAALFDYHRNYVQELAYLYRDDELAPHARWLLDNSSVPEMDQVYMSVYDFLYADPAMTPAPLDGLRRTFYGPGTGHVFVRSSWDEDATWWSLIGGPYTESHAHHDQGSIMLYKGGWLAYDPNVESNSGIRGEDALHNLVRITSGGSTVPQREGTTSEITALARGDGWVHAAADVTAAFAGAAAVQNLEREVVFVEPDVLIVFDRVAIASSAQATWQLSTPARPTVSGTRATMATAGHDLVIDRVLPATAPTIMDWTSDGDFGGGHRLDVTAGGGASQFLHVLSIDGAVTAATRSDDGGRIGVRVELADGRTATARFGTDGVDGTLTITGGGAGVDVALAPGIDD